jgi:hypothetical protein
MKVCRSFLILAVLGMLLLPLPRVLAQPWSLRPQDLQVQVQLLTLPAARQTQLQEQRDRVTPERFDLQRYPVTDATETHWRQTLWATAVLEPQRADIADAIAQILTLTRSARLSASQTKTVHMAMQVGTQLYQSNPELYAPLGERFWETLRMSPHAEWAAMSLATLVQTGLEPETAQQQLNILQARFSSRSPLELQIALRDLQEQLTPSALPPIADLLTWQVVPDQTQMYVFCRPDRDILCLGLLKDPQGRWVQNPEGGLWQVPLLARSLHGLRWNYVRGATPQGIFRVEGTMPRSSATFFRAYGQFPLVKMFMPFEDGVKNFTPSQSGPFKGAIAAYQTLLPPSWRGYFPSEQAYWAGRRGRGLIRIHGTGEPPGFFANHARTPESYNWNPAIVCIAAIELYDAAGRLQRADMPKILQTWSQVTGGEIAGYIVVVEIPGGTTPVTPSELGLA